MNAKHLMIFASCIIMSASAFAEQQAERRDPFTPLVDEKPHFDYYPDPMTPTPANPLAQYELGELRVIGIVLGELGSHAMLLAPDGNAYMISVGAVVGKFNGVVTDISANAVTVKETKTFQQDREVVNKDVETALKLNPLQDESAASRRQFVVLR